MNLAPHPPSPRGSGGLNGPSVLLRAQVLEVVVYAEQESTAKHRPVLERMLVDARTGRVQAVLVWALDRLHRSMTGAIQTVLSWTA